MQKEPMEAAPVRRMVSNEQGRSAATTRTSEPKVSPSVDTIAVRRMVSAEQKSYLELLACISQLAFLEEGLEKRIATIKGGKRYLRTGRGLLVRLANDLTRTMPEDQQKHIRRQLPALRMIVGVKAQMPRDTDGEHGRWLSFRDLDVVATAIRECCRACTLDDPQQQKQCMFAKLLDTLPTDKPDERAVGCGYFAIW